MIRLNYLAWVILVFAAIDVVFLGGKRRAFGVFVAKLDNAFNHSVSLPELNWIGDSYAALGYLLSVPCTMLILQCGRRFGLFQLIGSLLVLVSCISSAFVPNPHWLFLTHTLVHGLGSALIITVVALVVNEHFKDTPYEVLARTLVSGGSVASIVFVEAYALMIQAMGWRMALIALGVIYFVVLAVPVPIFRKNPEMADYVQRKCSLGERGVLRARQLPLCFMWMLDRLLTSVVTYGILLNLTDYMRRHKSTLVASAHLTTTFAAGEAATYAIGAIITAATRDFFKDRLRFVLLGATALMASAITLWQYVRHQQVFSYLCAFWAGFGMGPSITFLFPAGVEITTLEAHVAYPFTLSGMGLGMLLSPLLTSMIAQKFHFHYFFLVQAGLTWLKFSNLILIALYHRFLVHPAPSEEGYEEIPGSDEASGSEHSPCTPIGGQEEQVTTINAVVTASLSTSPQRGDPRA